MKDGLPESTRPLPPFSGKPGQPAGCGQRPYDMMVCLDMQGIGVGTMHMNEQHQSTDHRESWQDSAPEQVRNLFGPKQSFHDAYAQRQDA